MRPGRYAKRARPVRQPRTEEVQIVVVASRDSEQSLAAAALREKQLSRPGTPYADADTRSVRLSI